MRDTNTFVLLGYLLSAVLFIFGLKRLSKVRTAQRGNALAALAMAVAVVSGLADLVLARRLPFFGTGAENATWWWILGGLAVGAVIGATAATRVAMTSMPEMVALFNGFGGAASALVAVSYFWSHMVEPAAVAGTPAEVLGISPAVTLVLSILIGGVTLTGSLVAYLKLNGNLKGQPILLPGRHGINAVLLLGGLGVGLWYSFSVADPGLAATLTLAVFAAALVLGVMAVLPIGGADMPVVISLLNSYSGMAAAATGFVLENNLLIIAGALVGASGLILTQIMCVAMNRSLTNVLFGGFGAEAGAPAAGGGEYENVKSAGPEEAAMLFEAAESVIIVPGYGLAVAQAQHACKEFGDLLEKSGAKVTYAIHPVAGRMPGHMNVLLAEADVPYEKLVEMDQINPEFKNTDVVLVLGANDVVNPAAVETPGSPIAGMPVLEVWNARTVFVVKRSLGAGFAGIKNDLFERENTMMVFGDAKQVLQELTTELQAAAKVA